MQVLFLKHVCNFPSTLSLLFFLKGYPKTVQILLESGAHINWQNTAGETALIRVSFIGKKKSKCKAMSD